MSEQNEHSHPDYWQIYKWLLVLFVISVLGPFLFPEIKTIVLLTAFGIAIVKALLVVSNFMHLNTERKYIGHLFMICLVFLFVLFSAVAPDVMNKRGQNWVSDEFHGISYADDSGHEETAQNVPKLAKVQSPSAVSETPAAKAKEEETRVKKIDQAVPVETDPISASSQALTGGKTYQADPALVAQGKALFQEKICFTCHQIDPNVPAPAGLALKAPPFTGKFWGTEREVNVGVGGTVEKVKMNEEYFLESVLKPMEKIVKGAIPGMAPLPTTLSERKALMTYVRSLSK